MNGMEKKNKSQGELRSIYIGNTSTSSASASSSNNVFLARAIIVSDSSNLHIYVFNKA